MKFDPEIQDTDGSEKNECKATWRDGALSFFVVTTILFLILWINGMSKEDSKEHTDTASFKGDLTSPEPTPNPTLGSDQPTPAPTTPELDSGEEVEDDVVNHPYTEIKEMYSEVMGKMVKVYILAPHDWDKETESLPVLYELPGGHGRCTDYSPEAYKFTLSQMTNPTPGFPHDLVDDRSDRLAADWMFKKARYVMACTEVPPNSFFLSPWDDYFLEEFPLMLNKHWNTQIEGAALFGSCMGGYGALHLGFRAPEKFVAIAASQPDVFPGTEPVDLGRRENLPVAHLQKLVDYDMEKFFRLNPANILLENEKAIKESGLEIYLDVGDVDEFYFQDGTEYMHRLLFDRDIRHEFRFIRGEGHFNIFPRYLDSWEFAVDAMSGAIEKRRHVNAGFHEAFDGLVDQFEESDPVGMARNYVLINL